MPIIIDDNQTSDQLNDQLKTISTTLALHQQVDGKLFSKDFTGNGRHKRGHFSNDTDKLKDYLSEKTSKLYTENAARMNHNQAHITDQTLPRYYSSPQLHKDTYRKYAHLLTNTIPAQTIDIDDSAILKHLPNNELILPSDSTAFDIHAITKTWDIIQDKNGIKTATKIFIQSMELFEKEILMGPKSNPTQSKKKHMVTIPVCFVAFASFTANTKDDAIVKIQQKPTHPTDDAITMTMHYLKESRVSTSGIDEYNIEEQLERHLGQKVDQATIDETLKQILETSIAKTLESQAMLLIHQHENALNTFTTAILDCAAKNLTKNDAPEITKQLAQIVHTLENLAEYQEHLISTDFLAGFYQILKDHNTYLNQQQINKIVKQSLRLLLSQRLHELNEINAAKGLYQLQAPDQTVTTTFQNNPNYSQQQKRIILTKDPLVIGQAGAGSGKSHTLIGRIQYLRQQQEDLSKVLVLSFTNVAALNITNRFPDVRSETLANMFNTIYKETYPNQMLSQPSTVANSLRLLNPNAAMFTMNGFNASDVSAFTDKFAAALSEFDQKGFKRTNLQLALRTMSNLIEDNLELTTVLLNAVEQTTLELQPIIIHHQLLNNNNQLNIPQEYQDLNYIITDESQDISTFEYILLLELTLHYHSQLLIIGDGSQTLYEFRNSDPRYMNALESSGVFTAYKLDVNYRSGQEILLFANQFLDIIEANDFAKIQLTSSNFAKPTVATFKECVKIGQAAMYQNKPVEYHTTIQDFMTEDPIFTNWLVSKLKAGEQVALMAWTRAEIKAAIEALTQIISDNQLDIPITSIMSDNNRPLTILSDTIVSAKDDLLNAPVIANNTVYTQTICDIMTKDIAHRHKGSTAQLNFYQDTITNAIKQITSTPQWRALLNDVVSGTIPKLNLIGELNREIIRMETRKNAMDNYLKKSQKEIPDYDNSQLIVSTIHGAKGLEFQHTIILFNQDKKSATSQESLRMLFVALSRAKETEFIINAHVPRAIQTSVTSNVSDMFKTPMSTAYLRVIDDLLATPNSVTYQNKQAPNNTDKNKPDSDNTPTSDI